MGFSNYQGIQSPQGQSRISGRGFAVVDPERQREIDLDKARALSRRNEPSLSFGARPVPSSWIPVQRDPADEGGSVRRGLR